MFVRDMCLICEGVYACSNGYNAYTFMCMYMYMWVLELKSSGPVCIANGTISPDPLYFLYVGERESELWVPAGTP